MVELARRDFGPALVGSVLPFALVFYLALRGGGYDRVVYSEVGIAAWWLVLLGAVVGILPAARISRAGWIALGLLAAFVAWTALGVTWSESAERSVAEAGRVAAYLGVFALALTAQGRDGLRRTVNAVAAAIALVGVLALLSRLHPVWFPAAEPSPLLPDDLRNRLDYPLNYWNGLAALMAIGVPLVLVVALRARHLVAQALAAAALPAMALTAFYTFSRGGIIAAGLALLAFLALYPRRLATVPTLVVAGGGATVLVAAATQRDALEQHAFAGGARTEGDEMLAVVLIVCAGVALLQVAIGLAARHGLGPRPSISLRGGAALLAGAAVAATSVALAVGLPDKLADRSTDDAPAVTGSERFGSVSTENRRLYWESALDAGETSPLTGIGPGTFEFWWARTGEGGFVRDAHSVFFETFAELGIVGLLLIASALAVVLVAGIRRAVRSPSAARPLLAAAVASCVGFVVAAALDWTWELPVLPVAFLLLAAAIVGPLPASWGSTGSAPPEPRTVSRLWSRPRAGMVVLAILALVAITVPYLGTRLVRESQAQLQSGESDPALRSAQAARDVEPFAATPSSQRALVLAQSGDLNRAVDAAREATRDESTNYRTWLLLAALEAERGRAAEAVDAYDSAYERNPNSIVFFETSPEAFASRLGVER
jgi:O-antigen ligase